MTITKTRTPHDEKLFTELAVARSHDILCVGTHNGSFHADDLVAAVLAQLAHPNRTMRLARSRDPGVLELCHIVFDVGGVYNSANGRFDHHQMGGAGARPNGIKYSSAGLAWKEWGEAICRSHIRIRGLTADAGKAADAVDHHFIQVVDAVDNGQPLFSGGTPNFGENAHGLSLSGVLSSLNPCWFEEPTPDAYDTAFVKAALIAATFLEAAINSAIGAVMAEDRVREAVTNSPDPRVILLKGFLPWKEIIGPMSQEALYVVFPAEDGGGWRIQGVPVAPASFELRKALPAAWRAKPQAELAELTGVPDVVFCHGNGFIGGARSLEGALRMAELALQAE